VFDWESVDLVVGLNDDVTEDLCERSTRSNLTMLGIRPMSERSPLVSVAQSR
jgi:hypothetical protein